MNLYQKLLQQALALHPPTHLHQMVVALHIPSSEYYVEWHNKCIAGPFETDNEAHNAMKLLAQKQPTTNQLEEWARIITPSAYGNEKTQND